MYTCTCISLRNLCTFLIILLSHYTVFVLRTRVVTIQETKQGDGAEIVFNIVLTVLASDINNRAENMK